MSEPEGALGRAGDRDRDDGGPSSARVDAAAPGDRRGSGRALGVCAALALALISGRALVEQRMELGRAEQALAAGDLDRATVHLGRAARWRVPGIGRQRAALERLLEIGAAAEAATPVDRVTALRAYREVRGAVLATRAVVELDADLRARADARIAALMADVEIAAGIPADGPMGPNEDVGAAGDDPRVLERAGLARAEDREGRRAYHASLLAARVGPRPLPALLASAAFVGAWLAAALSVSCGLLVRSPRRRARGRPGANANAAGLGPEHVDPRRARRWLALAAGLTVTWMLALLWC